MSILLVTSCITSTIQDVGSSWQRFSYVSVKQEMIKIYQSLFVCFCQYNGTPIMKYQWQGVRWGEPGHSAIQILFENGHKTSFKNDALRAWNAHVDGERLVQMVSAVRFHKLSETSEIFCRRHRWMSKDVGYKLIVICPKNGITIGREERELITYLRDESAKFLYSFRLGQS